MLTRADREAVESALGQHGEEEDFSGYQTEDENGNVEFDDAEDSFDDSFDDSDEEF